MRATGIDMSAKYKENLDRRARRRRQRRRMLSEMTVIPEGRRLLRLEVRNAQTPVERKPAWMKARRPDRTGVLASWPRS